MKTAKNLWKNGTDYVDVMLMKTKRFVNVVGIGVGIGVGYFLTFTFSKSPPFTL